MRTRTTPAALTFALAFALGACSRDVTLPPEATAPRIQSIVPDHAYAGQAITIAASGLDPAADANLVQFPSAVARGERLSADGLVVRVPADAGTGPVTVQASGGVSAPWGAFGYLGLGQLRAGATISGEVPLLHKPYRLVAVGGDTFLHSDLLLSLVRYSDPTFVRDLAVSVDALPWSGAVAWLESEWDPDQPARNASRLVRLDVATGAVVEASVDFAGVGPIVALSAPSASPGAERIAVLRSHDMGVVTLALHDPGTLLEVQPEATLPAVVQVRGCADGGEGQLACLVRSVPDGPLSLALVTPGGSPTVQTVALATGDVVQEDPIDPEDPICAARTSSNARMAAIALDDGRIALARLDGGSPALAGHLDTGSRTPARSVACARISDPALGIGARLVVIAPKRADDLAVAVEAEAPGRIAWSASVPRASRAAVDVASGTVHLAGELDNRVTVLDTGGALLARRSLDVLPGREGAVQAAAWIPAGNGDPAALVFAVGSPPGVVELPLAAAPGTFPVYRNRSDAVGVFGPFAPYDPGYRYYFTLREQAVSQSGDLWNIGFATQIGQDGPSDAYVGTAGGLVTIDYSTMTTSLSGIAGAEFVSIGLLSGSPPRVFAAVGDASGWTVRAWSEARAAAGAAAESTWASPGRIAGAALLDGVLWAFHRDATDAFVATQLDDALARVLSVPVPEAFDRILAVSPNGRTFVTWEYQPWSWETSVVVWDAAGSGFARLATVPVPGVVSGVAFEGSGEALYVLTRSPDRVVVLE